MPPIVKPEHIKWFAVLTVAATTVMGGSSHAEVMDNHLFGAIELDRMEYRAQDGNDLLVWEAEAWIGTDYHKLVVKSDGEYERGRNRMESAETQLLYSGLVSDFFDIQAGLRYDFKPDPSRTYAVFGVSGLAPQWIEADAHLFLSDRGDVSGRLEAEYDLLITQKLIVQPTAELDFGFSEDVATDSGAGLRTLELGLRLRYEVTRKFAPYIGVNWERKLGKTADIVSGEGEDDNVFSLVAGFRAIF